MQSNTSFFNKGIQKQNIKQHGWLSIVYLLGLLFSIPLQMLLVISGEERAPIPQEHLFEDAFFSQIIFVTLVPVFAGIMMFRYIQVKASVDMIHSLPIQRKSLYINHLITGFILLVLPVWITGGVTALIVGSSPMFEGITYQDVGNWLLIASVMTIFSFIFSVCIGMLTGLSILQGVLTLILLVLPSGFLLLLTDILDWYLFGFARVYYESSDQLIKLSPITMLSDYVLKQDMVMYAVLAVVFGIVGYFLYKLRNVERASQALTFDLFKPIFKYGVTVCTMLISALYFHHLEHIGWIVFGYVGGSLLGYVVAEITLQKTWRIWGKNVFLGYAGYAVVIVLIGFIIHIDLFGYETSVPDKEEIKAVYFGGDMYKLSDETMSENMFSTDEQYIEGVQALHQAIVSKGDTNETAPGNYYAIAYQLEGGRKFVREYRITPDLGEKLANVVESEPYKRDMYNLEDLEKPLETISITSVPIHESVTISDPEEMNELSRILKYEISSMKMEDMIGNGKSLGFVSIYTDDENEDTEISLPWEKSFTELEKWLKTNNYLDRLTVQADDIKTMEVIYVPENRSLFPVDVFMEPEKFREVKEITNDKVIQKAINQYTDFDHDSLYYLRFVTNSGSEFYGVLPEGDVPEEIASKF